MQRYNIRVHRLDKPSQRQEDSHEHHRHALYATETIGLLMIAVFLLALTLVRYWHYIHWSLR